MMTGRPVQQKEAPAKGRRRSSSKYAGERIDGEKGKVCTEVKPYVLGLRVEGLSGAGEGNRPQLPQAWWAAQHPKLGDLGLDILAAFALFH